MNAVGLPKHTVRQAFECKHFIWEMTLGRTERVMRPEGTEPTKSALMGAMGPPGALPPEAPENDPSRIDLWGHSLPLAWALHMRPVFR